MYDPAPPKPEPLYDEFREAPPKRGPGCLFYGCLTAVVASVLFVAAVGSLVYFGTRFVIDKAKQYTDTAPAAIPPVEMAEEDRESLRERAEAFRKAVNAGEPTGPLVLDADDINALIDDQPELKGRAHVAIVGDKVQGQVSLPLRGVGLPALEGRYLNGEATLRVSLHDGVLVVMADEIKVKGLPLPPEFMASLRAKNLAEDALKNPETREAMSKLESVEVKDGQVIITPKKAEEPGEKAEAKGAEPKAGEEPRPEPEPEPAPEPAPAPAPAATDQPKLR